MSAHNTLYVLTLVASDLPLSGAIIGAVEVLLLEHGVVLRKKTWLAEEKAIDLSIDQAPDQNLLEQIEQILHTVKVDFFIQPSAIRKKKLLVADMDSTIVAEETLDEVASKLGLGLRVAAITRQSMQGELDFETSLRKRVALLAGQPASTLETVRGEMTINEGAYTLLKTMRVNGSKAILISGGFTYFTSFVADRVGFDHYHGNDLEIRNGTLTGFLIDPVLNPDAKLRFLNEYCAKYNADRQETLAVGDGANDRMMIKAAGLGIGYYPKPILENYTQNILRYGDLTALLFAQGYKKSEFLYENLNRASNA